MENFQQLSIYTLYDRPTDFPEDFVIRRFSIGPGTVIPDAEIFFKSKSVVECHSLMHQMGKHFIVRNEEDDKVIIGSYV